MIGPRVSKTTPAESRRAYQQVKDRSFGLCEICGIKPATETHHRQYRSRGGRDTVSNLIHVCGWGNHTGCHGRAHTSGQENGWSVPSGLDPAGIPVLYRGQWMLLTVDGGLQDGGDMSATRKSDRT